MWLYYFAKAVCKIAFNIWYKLDYHGLENIPSGGGYILMSNHRSMIDPIILAEKAHGQVRYMGKMELFRNPILGWALRTIGTFPVDRGAGDTSPSTTPARSLRRGIFWAFSRKDTVPKPASRCVPSRAWRWWHGSLRRRCFPARYTGRASWASAGRS